MRIPGEALPFFLSGNDNKALADSNRAEPVEGAARLRAAMSFQPSEQRQPATEDDLRADRVDQKRNHQKNRDEERRRDERRKENRPILLDTRTSQHRRKSTRHPSIDLKV